MLYRNYSLAKPVQVSTTPVLWVGAILLNQNSQPRFVHLASGQTEMHVTVMVPGGAQIILSGMQEVFPEGLWVSATLGLASTESPSPNDMIVHVFYELEA